MYILSSPFLLSCVVLDISSLSEEVIDHSFPINLYVLE